MATVASIDCGATSVRVCRVDLAAHTLRPEVVHRVSHTPALDASGTLRWDWDVIMDAITAGLEACLERGPLDSIGVDTWAVDYGLLDDRGSLLAAPVSYRDRRTEGYAALVDRIGPRELYALNGLQVQPFNTLFQLAAHDPHDLARAERLLWLPELIVHALTGVAVTERTSAGSSGLVDISTGEWSDQLLDLIGVERAILGDIRSAGEIVGAWNGIPVSLVGGHDTASAVAGMGPRSPGGSAFVSSGTWMLVGVERQQADTSEWARSLNFTNEAGALGGFRFLRNITGFWLLEQCRTHWGRTDIEALVGAAAGIADTASVPIVDVDAESLRNPDDMLGAYTSAAGLDRDAEPGVVTRSIVESIAAATAGALKQIQAVLPVDQVVLIGGAARMSLLSERLAATSGLRVTVGPAEAAALGNAVLQGVALGVFDDVAEGSVRIRRDPT